MDDHRWTAESIIESVGAKYFARVLFPTLMAAVIGLAVNAWRVNQEHQDQRYADLKSLIVTVQAEEDKIVAKNKAEDQGDHTEIWRALKVENKAQTDLATSVSVMTQTIQDFKDKTDESIARISGEVEQLKKKIYKEN